MAPPTTAMDAHRAIAANACAGTKPTQAAATATTRRAATDFTSSARRLIHVRLREWLGNDGRRLRLDGRIQYGILAVGTRAFCRCRYLVHALVAIDRHGASG